MTKHKASDDAEPGDEPPAKKSAGRKRPAAKAPPDADDAGTADEVDDAPKTKAAKKKASKKTATKAAKRPAAEEGEGDEAPAAKKETGKKAAAKKAGKKAPAAKKKGFRDDYGDLVDERAGDLTGDGTLEGDADESDGGEGTGRALVVVESPAKAKTINKYLGSGYRVMASMGHVRDLSTKKVGQAARRGKKKKGASASEPQVLGVAGVDIEHGFEPVYEPIEEKQKTIAELQRLAKRARAVFLASDPDREGEAIAWHVAELIKDQTKGRPVRRVTFNQITKDAIQKAFQAPRDLDMNRVNAQQARRVLDRIVGFQLSQLLGKKVSRKGASAGRVQSVATKLIVEREQEIQAFVAKEYWEFGALLDSTRLRGSSKPAPAPPPDAKEGEVQHPDYRFEANLVKWRGESLAKPKEGKRIEDAAQANALEALLSAASWRVVSVEQQERSNNPKPPFITSTLQQAASSLGYGAKRTMQIAQGLYEGVDLGDEGRVGLITYMRTDSFFLAPEAVAEARQFIGTEYGKEYLPDAPHVYRRKGLQVKAQEAHEAIRPSSALRTPDSIARWLDADQLKLYRLIWRRFVACQMTAARSNSLTVDVGARARGAAEDEATFRANGSTLLFDGHLRVAGREQDDRLLPPLLEGEALELVPPLKKEQKFTQPPPRYTEAGLVKKLEQEGIGRPSTYAAIIDTIQKREYVTQVNRALQATTKGITVTRKLEEFFADIMSYGYTRDLETRLDQVEGTVERTAGGDSDGDEEAGGDGPAETLPALDWRELLADFYKVFSKDLAKANREMKGVNEDPPVTDHPCPVCGKKMLRMTNTRDFSQFLGCPSYKEGCKTTVPLDEHGNPAPEQKIDVPCQRCGRMLVARSGRRGRFFACSGYPECQETFEMGADGLPVPKPDVKANCPKCEKPMTVKKGRTGHFLGCTGYPDCKGTLPLRQNPDGTWVIGQREQLPAVDIKCDRCGSPMEIKKFRWNFFLGCTAYPKCKARGKVPPDVVLPKPPAPVPFGQDCEQCGKPLVVRDGNWGPYVTCSGYKDGCRNKKNLPAGWVPPPPAPAAVAAPSS